METVTSYSRLKIGNRKFTMKTITAARTALACIKFTYTLIIIVLR